MLRQLIVLESGPKLDDQGRQRGPGLDGAPRAGAQYQVGALLSDVVERLETERRRSDIEAAYERMQPEEPEVVRAVSPERFGRLIGTANRPTLAAITDQLILWFGHRN